MEVVYAQVVTVQAKEQIIILVQAVVLQLHVAYVEVLADAVYAKVQVKDEKLIPIRWDSSW